MPKFPQMIFKMYRTRNYSNKTLTFQNLYKGWPGMHPSSIGSENLVNFRIPHYKSPKEKKRQERNNISLVCNKYQYLIQFLFED